MIGRNTLLSATVVAVFVFVCVSHATAAGFDCGKAVTAVEKLICSDGQLSELDNSLMQSYKKALASSGNSDALRAEQRSWLKAKRDKCQDIDCLKQAYGNRLAELNSLCDKAAGEEQPIAAAGSYDLSPKEKQDIINQINKDGKEEIDAKDNAIAMDSMSAEMVDLNNNSTYLVISDAYADPVLACGAHLYNCPMWLYEKQGDRYRLILEGSNIRIEKGSTNGYHNISTGMYWLSGAEHVVGVDEIYKYNGTTYKQAECWDVKDGERIHKKHCM